jgi:hypothetical protein
MNKTISLNFRLKWPDVKEDYLTLSEGHTIGRIRRTETAWDWYVEIPMAVPDWARGTGGTLKECQRAFASAWLRFLREHSPDRIERAWELERAAVARLHPRAIAKKEDPKPLPQTPTQVFDTERSASKPKSFPQASARNPDTFYFPPAEEKS